MKSLGSQAVVSYDKSPIKNLALSYRFEALLSSYLRKSLLGFRIFVKLYALLYTSLVASIDYTKHIVGLL